jgi:hypothetical protein
MSTRRPVLAVCLGVCLGATAAWAQDPHNGFFLTSPLSLSSGWDQNFVTGYQQLYDTEALLTGPTFAWMKSTHKTDFFIDYQPEIEIYAHNPGLDAWNHISTLRMTHRVNGRLSVDIGNYFLSTNDPTRALSNSLLILPLGRFEQNSFHAGLTYLLGHRTKLVFRAENTYTNSSGVVGPLAGRLDELGSAGTVTLEHKFNASNELTGSYSFLHVDPLSNTAFNSATNVNLLNVAYDYTVNPGLVLHVSGGAVETRQNALLGAAAVEKKLKGVWFAGGYQRYVSFFGGLTPLETGPPAAVGFSQGLVPSNVYQVATFRGWGQLTKRVGLEAGAQRALTGVNLLGQDVRGVTAHIRLDYRVNDRFVWFARAEYYDQNVAEFVPFPGARRRYMAGIEIALTRPPEAANARNRHGQVPADTDDPTIQEPDKPEER